jgi:sec-independent protein translocase protein TatC
VSIPTDDPHIAPTSAEPGSNGTNGVVSHVPDASSPTDSSATIQAASSTTDAPSAPVPYEPALPPASPPPPNGTGSYEPAGGAPEEEEEGMTMLEHLEELRDRLIVCSVALVAGLVISAVPIPYLTDGISVTQAVMELVARPAEGHLQYLQPGEGFVTYFQLAMMMGFVLALPVVTYQLIAFVLPALLPHEKKYLYMALPGAMFSFVVGVLFGYILVIPVAIQFLLNWNPIGITMMWQFSEYIGTVSTLLLWMGLAFETPLLMFFLTKLRVLNPARVARFRKYMLILSFVIGAIITPTPDPLNQTIVSLPLYLLFELGLLLSRLA